MTGVEDYKGYAGLEVVVPDDYPPTLVDSLALLRIRKESPIPVRIHNERVNSERGLLKRIRNAHTVICMNATTQMRGSVIESCPDLRHIAIWGESTEQVDVSSADRMNVTVTKATGNYARAVAEHALAMVLALAHRLSELDERIRVGEWPGGVVTQLGGKVMGIVGGGEVGSCMADISAGIGMEVIFSYPPGYSGRQFLGADSMKAKKVTFDTLLRDSDVISLHAKPDYLAPKIFGAEEFARMKSSALFVNTASSRLVDEATLLSALDSEMIAGAALDVFSHEPLDKKSYFIELPNVILTPHIAAHTPETVERSLKTLADNLFGVFSGRLESVERVV